MILSNVSIHKAIDNGWLTIEPEPSPRTPSNGDPECPYNTSAVDLRLGREIAWFRDDMAFSIDLKQGDFRRLFAQNSVKRELNDDQPFQLMPQRLVLGKTLEKVTLPIIDDGTCLAARVEGKSSYSRCGLLVHFTAPTIHSGFSGTITLELINLGTIPILLHPEIPICQLIIEQVDGVPIRRDSQFQGQTTVHGA
ncbi:MAG: dCTP deaminase [Planctomycetes bacterium]|nr:dCTP deaminase [Planctomycetota bacterium]MCH8210080.1 dCTP deaminase [Planctomycetota bacterium]MCH8260955.1 dCTP deaminase [Planctomycetota bacterium]